MGESRLSESDQAYWLAFSAGVVSAATMSLVLFVFRLMGWTEFSFERALGELLPGRVHAGAVVLGFAWHVVNGGLVALVYARVFKHARLSFPWIGTTLAFVQATAVLFLLGLFAAPHPGGSVDGLPGDVPAFGARLDAGWVLAFVFVHLLFGGLLGALCEALGQESVVVVDEELPEIRRAA